eukprot:16430335-Heterocapsa_arctica.AAC.1
MKFKHTLYRIGEASNPGPSHTGCHSKQRKLVDLFHQHHTKKDGKDMWRKEEGYTIENIAGDGNCLYACLGRSRNSPEIESDKLYRTMQIDYGTLTCNMMWMKLNWL